MMIREKISQNKFYKTTRTILAGTLVLLFAGILHLPVNAQITTLDWLEDQTPTNKITHVQTNKFTNLTGYPRRSTGSVKQGMNAQQMSCFDIICQKPFTATTVQSAQSINPNLSYLRIYSPQAWQGELDGPDKSGNGYPFNTSGPATANNQIFAGHWAYQPYTTLTAELPIGTQIPVSAANTARFRSGTYYYVIRPADSWENAEHIEVTKSGSTLTVKSRGFKSVAKVWPAGSIIAEHQLGNGSGTKNWVYNLSTKCPKDANGKKAHEAFSSWLALNYDKDGNGNQSTASVDGIQYDADPLAFVDGGGTDSRDADLDNDGVSDWGYESDGTNFWGEGLELFYSGVRDGLDKRGKTNAVILGGVAESYGVIPNNGTQMEAAWSHQFGEDGSKAGVYNHINFYISGMKAQTGHGIIGPRVTDVHSKEASAIYYGSAVETRNAPVRFSYSMTMMFDGAWFSNQNGFGDAFHYFDEDAVYTSSGANYGKSVLKTNFSDIRANSKWLGKALGQYKRVYDVTKFSKELSLIPNGDFEAPLSPWSGNQVTTTRVTDQKYEGTASILITPNKPNTGLQLDDAFATGPTVTLVANQEYTLCFAVYSEAAERIIRPRIGSVAQKMFVPPGWSKHVISWKEATGGASAIKFDVGGELTKVWIDQLYLFAGSADVFRRDFENGIVLSNAGNSAKTIALNGTFQRIRGNLDTQVNNGQTVTEVTLPAHDGLFLIKPMGSTGLNDINDSKAKAYPNPFTQDITFDVPDGVNAIEIYNSGGNLIYKNTIENVGEFKIEDFKNYPTGIYFTKLSGAKKTEVLKIVKR